MFRLDGWYASVCFDWMVKIQMKRKLVFLIMIIINLLLPIIAMGNNMVSISLPEFEIKMNNVTIENDMRKYPFIVYNDITYVPMTYQDSKFLGLNTDWNKYNGLNICKIDSVWKKSPEMQAFTYSPEMQSVENISKDQASISMGDIKINGEQIDVNSIRDAEYPILVYRDVTYFPLTWHYAVEEFEWEYSFDSINGLIIRSSSE